MKPKNSKERRSSFIKFLILYFVTTATVVAAVYFNYRVPEKENELLREKTQIVESEMEFQSNFSEQLKEVGTMIEALEAPGAQIALETQQIAVKLVDMRKTLPTKDSTHLHGMYSMILDDYGKMLQDKERLIELNQSEKTIDELKENLNTCREYYEQCKRDLDIARR